MKKLEFKKDTVANLSKDQMDNIRGMSIVFRSCLCNGTASCSLLYYCCTPEEEKIIEENRS